MAFKEIWTSQEITVDAEGSRFRRVFHCELASWLDGSFYYRVGQSLSYDDWFPVTQWTNALIINEINARPTENQSVLVVDVYYSTNTSNRGYERPDQLRSWEFNGGVSATERVLDRYVKTSYPGPTITQTTLQEEWEKTDVWIDADEEDKPAPPELPIAGDYHEMTFTLYGSILHLYKLSDAVGKVNSKRFLDGLISAFELGADAVTDRTGTINDWEKWRLCDLRYSRLRIDCWRYDLTFRQYPAPVALTHSDWSKYNWNQPYGDEIKVGANAWNIGAYPELDFITLFDGMNKYDPEELQGGGSP